MTGRLKRLEFWVRVCLGGWAPQPSKMDVKMLSYPPGN